MQTKDAEIRKIENFFKKDKKNKKRKSSGKEVLKCWRY